MVDQLKYKLDVREQHLIELLRENQLGLLTNEWRKKSKLPRKTFFKKRKNLIRYGLVKIKKIGKQKKLNLLTGAGVDLEKEISDWRERIQNFKHKLINRKYESSEAELKEFWNFYKLIALDIILFGDKFKSKPETRKAIISSISDMLQDLFEYYIKFRRRGKKSVKFDEMLAEEMSR